MAKVLYPRSDSISAKVIEPSDFETMFGFIGDYIINGFTVTAGSGLDVDVSSGKIRLKGLVVESTASENVGSLTDNTVNYIYAVLARDGNSQAESWDFSTNTSGTLPTDGLKIAKVTTSSGAVTAVAQVNQTDTFKYAFQPTGSVEMYAGQYNNIPTNWLLCDGSAISRTTYKDLFDVVGIQFGNGDGSTTFNLPDLRAKFPRGANASANPGNTGGADSVTLTTSELPAHNHSVSDPGHTHTANVGDTSGGDNYIRAQISNAWGTTSVNSNTTGISIGNTGGGAAHENRPAFVELLFIIKI